VSIDLRYRIVDVFTEVPLAGNALCVVLDPCPEPVMAAIAREVNLSETTFPVVTGEDRYEMRIFTPTSELPFAGHPSLGTAWVLGSRRWTQSTEGATVVVEAHADGAVMQQPRPTFTQTDPAAAAASLGLGSAESAQVAEAAGLRHLLVSTAEPLERLSPYPAELANTANRHRATTVCAVRRLDDHTVHVRVFAPGVGVAEDPGTGSAAGPIAVMANMQWGTARQLAILQGAELGRPSRIEVQVDEGGVQVGGRVTPCAEGRFTL
jgi:trans-2,3-dihydro-3-hydroxyanthranilate isomerase